MEKNNNKKSSIQNRYLRNQNYNNKTHLIKRNFNNKIINHDNSINNLTPKLIQNKIIKIYSNSNLMENTENRVNRVINNYDNYNYPISNSSRAKQTIHKIKNDLAKSTQVEMEKENQFVKNNNDEYNNIFFYTSNTEMNKTNNFNNELNDNKYKFQHREKSDFINYDMEDDNNNYNINMISNKKENKMKSKYIYKKNGNLNENNAHKIVNNKNNSLTKVKKKNKDVQISEKSNKNLPKEKNQNNIINKNIKRDKSEDIISMKTKRSHELKKRQVKENRNFQNYKIKKHVKKIRKKKSFNNIDIKIPTNDKEKIITINIKKDNINEIIEHIIKDYYLDESYYDPLLLLINNSINILNNIDNMKIYKNIKIDNQKLYRENREATSSEFNNLDFSLINDLIENKKYKDYIEDLYYDNEEINDNAKILNMSI